MVKTNKQRKSIKKRNYTRKTKYIKKNKIKRIKKQIGSAPTRRNRISQKTCQEIFESKPKDMNTIYGALMCTYKTDKESKEIKLITQQNINESIKINGLSDEFIKYLKNKLSNPSNYKACNEEIIRKMIVDILLIENNTITNEELFYNFENIIKLIELIKSNILLEINTTSAVTQSVATSTLPTDVGEYYSDIIESVSESESTEILKTNIESLKDKYGESFKYKDVLQFFLLDTFNKLSFIFGESIHEISKYFMLYCANRIKEIKLLSFIGTTFQEHPFYSLDFEHLTEIGSLDYRMNNYLQQKITCYELI